MSKKISEEDNIMWFGCNVSDINFKFPEKYNLFDNLKSKVHSSFNDFLNNDEVISGEKVMEAYFPSIEADVFISHSHKDFDLAKNLAGWLHQNFGLISFIDSMIWGYSDDLLKKIDNEYCLFEDRKTYSYEKRNLSTAYIHMMLAKSLTDMMNKCDCLFFLNTDQSICASEIDSKCETFSPWIFYELDAFNKMKKRVPKQISFSQRQHTAAIDKIAAEEKVQILLPANMGDLKNIDSDTLNSWSKKHKDGHEAIMELALLLAPHILQE